MKAKPTKCPDCKEYLNNILEANKKIKSLEWDLDYYKDEMAQSDDNFEEVVNEKNACRRENEILWKIISIIGGKK
jgi:hypothetical protein